MSNKSVVIDPSKRVTRVSIAEMSLDAMSTMRSKLSGVRDTVAERLAPKNKAKGLIGKLDPFRQQRYRNARRRWSTHAGGQQQQPGLYDSNLQAATYLLRLAISLEAAKDKKRWMLLWR